MSEQERFEVKQWIRQERLKTYQSPYRRREIVAEPEMMPKLMEYVKQVEDELGTPVTMAESGITLQRIPIRERRPGEEDPLFFDL